MNKKLLLLVLLVLFFVVGGLVYVSTMSKPKSPMMPEQGAPVHEQSTNTDRDVQGSIFDLIKMGRALNCKFSGTDPKSEGEIFILGNKLKGDFLVDGGAGAMTASHIVSDGTFMYVWGDEMEQGIKMNYSDVDVEKAKTDTNLKSLNANYDYSCSDWAVVDSYFIAPSEINFMDVTALQEMIQPEGGPGVDMCISCGVIPDATAKQECLTQFKCAQ